MLGPQYIYTTSGSARATVVEPQMDFKMAATAYRNQLEITFMC